MLGMTGTQTMFVVIVVALLACLTIATITGDIRRVRVARYTSTADADRRTAEPGDT